jgi:hypothetical protein
MIRERAPMLHSRFFLSIPLWIETLMGYDRLVKEGNLRRYIPGAAVLVNNFNKLNCRVSNNKLP